MLLINLKNFTQLLFIYLFLTNIAYSSESITIEKAWSPEAPPVVKVMAGYMKINNLSNKDIKIKSLKSKLFKRVEIHLTKMENGMMHMVKQENLTIKAKSYVELKPGELHMMLIGKLKAINAGSSIPLILSFDNGESININLTVKTDNQPEMKCGSMMNH